MRRWWRKVERQAFTTEGTGFTELALPSHPRGLRYRALGALLELVQEDE